MTKCIIDVETTGLNPLDSRIIVIGCKIPTQENEKYFQAANEKLLLKDFWSFVKQNQIKTLIGFNIDFDWTFIKVRSLRNRIYFKWFSAFSENKIVDLRKILNDKYKAKGKLSDYCRLFGIPHNTDLAGVDVPQYYLEGKLDLILEHIKDDVVSTWELYKLISEFGGLIL